MLLFLYLCELCTDLLIHGLTNVLLFTFTVHLLFYFSMQLLMLKPLCVPVYGVFAKVKLSTV